MMSSLVPTSLYESQPSPLFSDKSMAFDFKPDVLKQQLPLEPPCLLASTPELEQALLSFSAACSVNSAPPAQVISAIGSAGSVASAYSTGTYPSVLAQSSRLFRPESADSPLSTASSSASVTPSPLSGSLLATTSGTPSTAFPFDGTVANSSSSGTKSSSVHSQSVAAALAGLPLAALQPDMQDQLKKQRKKERNRVAAMKCRKRKLEREADLEEHVSKLKGHNGELAAEVASLRQQVIMLKQTVMKHVNSGCNMLKGAEHDVASSS